MSINKILYFNHIFSSCIETPYWAFHNLLNQSLINGNSGYFQLFNVVNNAVMNQSRVTLGLRTQALESEGLGFKAQLTKYSIMQSSAA